MMKRSEIEVFIRTVLHSSLYTEAEVKADGRNEDEAVAQIVDRWEEDRQDTHDEI